LYQQLGDIFQQRQLMQSWDIVFLLMKATWYNRLVVYVYFIWALGSPSWM
jgi:hypothetical protein